MIWGWGRGKSREKNSEALLQEKKKKKKNSEGLPQEKRNSERPCREKFFYTEEVLGKK